MFRRPWRASQRSQLPPELPPAVQSLFLPPLLPSPKYKRGLVLEEGVEPPRPFGPRDFESRHSGPCARPCTLLHSKRFAFERPQSRRPFPLTINCSLGGFRAKNRGIRNGQRRTQVLSFF